MRYKEALNIGTQCAGIVQCTYATIYNSQGRALFSLQNKDARYDGYVYTNADKENHSVVYQVSDELYFAEQLISSQGYIQDNHGTALAEGANAFINKALQLPIVVATEYSPERLVPAMLTEQAVDFLKRACERIRGHVYIIYLSSSPNEVKDPKEFARQYTKPTDKQLRQISVANQNCKVYYEIQPSIAKKYLDLISILESGEEVYVKPAAFCWIPTEIKAVDDITGLQLRQELEAAKKKYEQARTLLFGAAATNII